MAGGGLRSVAERYGRRRRPGAGWRCAEEGRAESRDGDGRKRGVLGMAMATYTGQNYGAGKPDRILSGVKSATLIMVEYSVVIAAVMWALADKFALLFISPAETEIMKDTVLFLHINTSSFILLGSLSILRYTIQGAGYTRLSIFSGVSEMIARVLVSLYLVPALKFVGVCLGDPTAWLFANLFLILAFVYVYHQLKGRMSINGVPANA